MAAHARSALANLRFPESPEPSIQLVIEAVAETGAAGAGIVCFPECYPPGYRSQDLDLSLATGLLTKRFKPMV